MFIFRKLKKILSIDRIKKFQLKNLYVCKVFRSHEINTSIPYTGVRYWNGIFISKKILYGESLKKSLFDPITGITYINREDADYENALYYLVVAPLADLSKNFSNSTLNLEDIKKIDILLNNNHQF